MMEEKAKINYIMQFLNEYLKARNYDIYVGGSPHEIERISLLSDMDRINQEIEGIDWLNVDISKNTKKNINRIIKILASLAEDLYNDLDGNKTIKKIRHLVTNINDIMKNIQNTHKSLSIGDVTFFLEREKITKLQYKKDGWERIEITTYDDLKLQGLHGCNQRGLSILYAIAKLYQLCVEEGSSQETVFTVDIFDAIFQKHMKEFVDICVFTNFKKLYKDEDTDVIKRGIGRISALRIGFLQKNNLHVEIKKRPGRKSSCYDKEKLSRLEYVVVVK